MVLSRADLRYARTWPIILALCWLGSAALRMSETGNRDGTAAWVAMATPLLFIGAAVYGQNRLERLKDDAPQVRRAMPGEDHVGGCRL